MNSTTSVWKDDGSNNLVRTSYLVTLTAHEQDFAGVFAQAGFIGGVVAVVEEEPPGEAVFQMSSSGVGRWVRPSRRIVFRVTFSGAIQREVNALFAMVRSLGGEVADDK